MCRAIGMRVHYRGDFIWFYHPLLSVPMEHELGHVEVDVCVAYSAFSHFSRRRKQKRTKTNSKFGSTIPFRVRVSCNVMPRALCTVNVDDVHVATVKRQPPVTHLSVCACVSANTSCCARRLLLPTANWCLLFRNAKNWRMSIFYLFRVVRKSTYLYTHKHTTTDFYCHLFGFMSRS